MTEKLVSPTVARSMSGGLSASTVRRLVQAGDYPAPVALGRDRHGKPVRVAFVESEVTAWVRRRIEAERGTPTAAPNA